MSENYLAQALRETTVYEKRVTDGIRMKLTNSMEIAVQNAEKVGTAHDGHFWLSLRKKT